MIKYVKGNLLDAEDRDIILQQVNCQGAMNSGIARQIRARYPDVFTSYKAMCDEHKDNTSELLGSVDYFIAPNYLIANCFGQDKYGRDKRYTSYAALKECFENVATNKGCRIGIPYKIGCGLGGGDWDVVSHVIHNAFKDMDVKIYIYEE